MTRDLHDESDFGDTYSAHIEDYIIRKLLPYRTGTYVDIGAYHPIEQSNTYALYKRGWRGILIEPQPEYARQLRETRPEDATYECAASYFEGTADLRLWWGASSIKSEWPIPPDTGTGEATGVISVRVVPFQHILQQHPQIARACDLCSIDVEGAEEDVLRAIDFDIFRPQLFVVESAEWKTLRLRHAEWEHYLTHAGYTCVCHNFVNRFYVAKECADVLDRSGAFKL